jgi:hypothetical protein
MTSVYPNCGYELSLTDHPARTALVSRGINVPRNDNSDYTNLRRNENSYHTNVRRNDNSYRTNVRIFVNPCRTNDGLNEGPSGVTVIGCRVTFVISSARPDEFASVARVRFRLPDRVCSKLFVGSHARSASSLNPFRLPLDLISHPASFHVRPRLALHLISCSIFSPARFAASVSTHAMPFSVWFPTSLLDQHSDGCASPRRVPLICAPRSPDLRRALPIASPLPGHRRTASCKFLRCYRAAIFAGGCRDPRRAAHSPHPARE